MIAYSTTPLGDRLGGRAPRQPDCGGLVSNGDPWGGRASASAIVIDTARRRFVVAGTASLDRFFSS